ncbi:hypothetical protein L2E82_53692 [Cichorium intybus]|nr:hypothetical protein L2E82_53692 [Cichorium intybus]
MSNDKSCEKHDRPASGRFSAFSQSTQSESVPKEPPERAAVRWVHESDEVALTTEPCLSRANMPGSGSAHLLTPFEALSSVRFSFRMSRQRHESTSLSHFSARPLNLSVGGL